MKYSIVFTTYSTSRSGPAYSDLLMCYIFCVCIYFYRIGIVTGIFGLVSTLAPLHAFATACVTDLQPSVSYVTMQTQLGTAFYLLTAATMLKVVDVIAHLIVPVPEKGYWEPGNDEAAKGGEISMTDFKEQKWEKCSVEVGHDASSDGAKTQPTYSKV